MKDKISKYIANDRHDKKNLYKLGLLVVQYVLHDIDSLGLKVLSVFLDSC